MRTTMDGAGRIVVPKAAREAMGLRAGQEIDIVFTNGRIEIEVAPAEVHLETAGELPRLTRMEAPADLSDDEIRATIEGTRR